MDPVNALTLGLPADELETTASTQILWVRAGDSAEPPEIHVEAGRPLRLVFCAASATAPPPRLAEQVNGHEPPVTRSVTIELPPHDPGTYNLCCELNAMQAKLIVEQRNGGHPRITNGKPPSAINGRAIEPADGRREGSVTPIGGRRPRTARGLLLQRLLEQPGLKFLLLASDLAMLSAAVLLAQGGTSGSFSYTAMVALPPLAIALFFLNGMYRAHMRALALDSLVPVTSGVSTATMAITTVGVLSSQQVPSESVLYTWAYALVGVGLGRVVLANAQRWARRRRLTGRPVLIAGAGLVGQQLAKRLNSHPEYGLLPVGFIDENPPRGELGANSPPLLGGPDEIDQVVRRTHARHLIVAFSLSTDARMSRLVQHCQRLGVEVSVVPRLFETINHRTGYEAVGGVPVLSFTTVDPRGWQFAVKYAIDRICAGAILVALAPLLALITVLVKLSTGGPVLFRQPRVGLDGRQFDMLKFRTMRGAPEQRGEQQPDVLEQLLPADTAPGGVEGVDRRTRVGLLLRRLSLDELPQLWNVLNGEMSLIGPRPERVNYVRRFEPVVYRYAERHRVKSGITGLAQVHGLRGQTSLAERVEWDNYYIANWSLGLDVKILLLTLIAAFRNAE